MSQDFGKGKIYKITNDYNDEVYVGSTCDLLTKRFSNHKKGINCKTKQNRPIYKLMNEIGFERFRIELIEDYPCTDKYELRQREAYYIREIGTLNSKIECRTQKQYQEDNKEQIQKNKQEYYEANKDKLLERQNEKITCTACGSIIRRGETARHKRSIKHQELMKISQTLI